MPIRVVTFDFHNTIARCDAWFALEVRDLVPAVLRWHADQTGETYSSETLRSAVEHYRAIRLEIMDHGIEQDAFECTMNVLDALGITIAADVVEAGIDAVMQPTLADAQPIPGVVDAVHALAEHDIRLGVVSSAVYHPFLERSLEKFGIHDRFDSVITSARAGFYKSRPDIYTHSLERLGAVASETVHVGDSYRFDVQTARKAGIGTVWFRAGDADHSGHEADIVVDTLEGVAPLIMERFNGAN